MKHWPRQRRNEHRRNTRLTETPVRLWEVRSECWIRGDSPESRKMSIMVWEPQDCKDLKLQDASPNSCSVTSLCCAISCLWMMNQLFQEAHVSSVCCSLDRALPIVEPEGTTANCFRVQVPATWMVEGGGRKRSPLTWARNVCLTGEEDCRGP